MHDKPACPLFFDAIIINSVYQMNGRRVHVLLNLVFFLVILNICSQNQASVVFIAKFGSNSSLKKTISLSY